MSQENVELLGRMFELFSERGSTGTGSSSSSAPTSFGRFARTFQTPASTRATKGFAACLMPSMRRLGDVVPAARIHPRRESRRVPLRWGGLGIGSGAAFAEREETWVFTLSDGRIRHVREYGTKREALAAVGLQD